MRHSLRCPADRFRKRVDQGFAGLLKPVPQQRRIPFATLGDLASGRDAHTANTGAADPRAKSTEACRAGGFASDPLIPTTTLRICSEPITLIAGQTVDVISTPSNEPEGNGIHGLLTDPSLNIPSATAKPRCVHVLGLALTYMYAT